MALWTSAPTRTKLGRMPEALPEKFQRICFTLQVKPSRIAEYKSRHAEVWPEMLQALREAGWHNYSLFLRDDGLLIGYVETPVPCKTR